MDAGHAVSGHADAARDDPVEAVRGLAIVLLVIYHVIGSGPGSGLDAEYGTVLRFCADLLVDVRMPLFACLAGYVYAHRPPQFATFGRFVDGKLRRLALPGAVAILLFAVSALLVGNRFALPWAELWRPLLYPYAHYWFLQAILLIFLVYGALDAILRHRGTVILLALAALLFWADWRVPTRLMSVNHALYLLPFFLVGVAIQRHPPRGRTRWVLAWGALGVGLGGLALNGLDLIDARSGGDRHDLQSLVTGTALCVAAMLAMPRWAALGWMGPYGLTIYLYHVFATAGLRMGLEGAGLAPGPGIALALGLAAGIGGPVLLHQAVARIPAGRVLVLGLRADAPAGAQRS